MSDSCCLKKTSTKKTGAPRTQRNHEKPRRTKHEQRRQSPNDRSNAKLQIFRRYKSSYSSDSPQSGSSEEESPAEAIPEDVDEKKRTSQRSCCSPSVEPDNFNIRGSSQREPGHLESTVEKHVFELNFPRSPAMNSISNLLEQCPYNLDNENDKRFVHQIKTGQTCELQGDSQIIRVCVPEPFKVTVEHLLKPLPKTNQGDENVESPLRLCEVHRGSLSGHRHKNTGAKTEPRTEPPRYRRRRSYVR